jgi:hypothetical protein
VHRVVASLLILLIVPFARPSFADEESATAPAELGEAPLFSTGPLSYRPGRGLRLNPPGLVVGGFTNIKGEYTEEANGEFAVDALNFFVIFDHFTRFRVVADLQLKDIFVADQDQVGTQDFAFDARRLFGELTLLDELHVRAGTFLTPVGYWNLILAPPLTWTTEPPLISEEVFFQQTTTGVMLHGSTGAGGGQLGYSLFSQFLKPLEDDPDLEPPDHTAGARLTYDPAPGWSAGASYQAAELNNDWTHFGALHGIWQPQRGEVSSEVHFLDGEGQEALQWGTYLQGVLQVYGPLYLVGRYEHFNPAEEGPVNLITFGGVWKPFPFMAIKIEYRVADHRLEEERLGGFFSSFSTLF